MLCAILADPKLYHARRGIGNAAQAHYLIHGMRNVRTAIVSLLLITAATLVVGQSAELAYQAGRINDGSTAVPDRYTSFTPPSVGQTFDDPTFGTRITRISEGGAFHEYATMSPFNSDESLILLQRSTGYWVVDRVGTVVRSTSDLALDAGARAKWSHADPFRLFYYEANRLMTLDVSTLDRQVLHTFTQYRSVSDAGGASDVSEDGDHLLVLGDGRFLGVFEISTRRLGPTLSVQQPNSEFGADLGADNQVVVGWVPTRAGGKQAMEVYDRDMRLLRALDTTGGHWDLGRDVDGSAILLTFAWSDENDPDGCAHGGLIKTRLSDGVETCVAPGFEGSHVSAVGSKPWVIVGVMDHTRGTAAASLPSNWRSLWQPYDNEILLIKTDGSVIRRLAHHRSRLFGSYYYFPFAAFSRAGRFALYNSNMGHQPFGDYSDAYLLDLGASLPATDAPANTEPTPDIPPPTTTPPQDPDPLPFNPDDWFTFGLR